MADGRKGQHAGDSDRDFGLGQPAVCVFPYFGPEGGTVGSGISVGTNGVTVVEHGNGYMPTLLVFDAPIIGWTHVAVVYSNCQPTLYLNGAPVRSGLTSLNPSCPSTWLGERGAASVNQGHYAGLLDEVSIYDRPLSPTEIQAVYNTGSVGKCGDAPFILSQPTNQTAFVGATVVFAIRAGGVPPLYYQWQFEGTNLPGATEASLVLTSVQLDRAGAYSLVVTNGFGLATSSNALLTVQPPPPCVPTPAGLAGWWRAESRADDVVGGNDGSLFNGASLASGKVGQAFNLDGADDHVRILDSPPLRFTNAMTVEAWVYPSSIGGVHREVVSKWSLAFGYDQRAYTLVIQPNGLLHFTVSQDGGGQTATAASTNSIPVNQWSHLAATYDGGKLRVYRNGVLDGESAFVGGIFPGTADLGLGGVVGGGIPGQSMSPFAGSIDDVALYNRALTDAEIRAVYNADSQGKCCEVAPRIFAQPSPRTVRVGSRAAFEIGASGCDLVYQWQRDGQALAEATSSTLSLTNVQPGDAGAYSVVASNAFGSVLSSNATLVVDASCISAAPGLVSWWPGEGTADDWIGGQHGVLRGGLAIAAGLAGQAFTFNGANAYLTIPAATNLNVGAADGFTVEGWINPADVDSAHAVWEWNNGAGGVGVHLWFSVGGFGPENSRAIYVNLTDTSGASHPMSSPAGTLASGVYQHIALTYSKTNGEAKLYHNGNVVAVQNLGSFTPQTDYAFHLGARPGGGGAEAYFQGMMDEVAVYNCALTDKEIRDVFNAGDLAKSCAPPQITAQPQAQSITPGASVTFSVSARGLVPLHYQWRWQGADLPGATNVTFTLLNAQPSDAGAYSVLVINAQGSLASSNALLKVNVITVKGDGQTLASPVHYFGGPVTIQLENFYTNGFVFYSLDGSEPSFLSEEYTGPFVVSQNALVRALGYSVDLFEAGESDPIQILIVPSYPLTASIAGGGSILSDPDQNSYLSNSVVTLTAVPDTGWMFLHWTGDASGSNPETAITMTRQKSVQAIFGTRAHTTAAGGGSVAVHPAAEFHPYGATVTFTAVPQLGRFFGIWGNAGSGNINPLMFVVTNPELTIASLFASVPAGQAVLSAVPVGMGQIMVSPQANVYAAGTDVTVTATPGAGQSFLGWSGDAAGLANPLALTLNMNKLIFAHFSSRPYLAVLNAENAATDGISLLVTGSPGETYRLESTTNLYDWRKVADLTNTLGMLTFADQAITNANQIYYRVMLQ